MLAHVRLYPNPTDNIWPYPGELFGIAHLHPEQPPTEAAPYAPDAPYPTGVVVQCEACDMWLPLPDKVSS